jgi:hypothetical protein
MLSVCSMVGSNNLINEGKDTKPFLITQTRIPVSPSTSTPALKSYVPSTPEFTSAEAASAACTPTSLPLGENFCIQPKSVLSEERRRVWVHGPRPEYKKNSQRFNLPSRIIPLLRPNLDVVILPGAHPATKEVWEFCRETLGLQEWQALFTSGNIYNMDDDVDDEMINNLRETMLKAKCGWTLVPYCVTPNFKRWASLLAEGPGIDLDLEIFGEELEWVDRFGHKGALHRHMRSLDTPR